MNEAMPGYAQAGQQPQHRLLGASPYAASAAQGMMPDGVTVEDDPSGGINSSFGQLSMAPYNPMLAAALGGMGEAEFDGTGGFGVSGDDEFEEDEDLSHAPDTVQLVDLRSKLHQGGYSWKIHLIELVSDKDMLFIHPKTRQFYCIYKDRSSPNLFSLACYNHETRQFEDTGFITHDINQLLNVCKSDTIEEDIATHVSNLAHAVDAHNAATSSSSAAPQQ
jgi:hypothetical protein